MMLNSQTAHRLRSRSAVLSGVALAAATMMMLTGCSGSGIGGSKLDGTYYAPEINGTSQLGQLVIDGDTATHHEYDCDGVYEEPDVISTGELSEDQTMITWTVAGEDMRNDRTGSEVIGATENSISINGDVYVNIDSNAGKQLFETFEEGCKS